jgi:hypothetical protein
VSARGELTARAAHAEPADFFTTYNAKQAEIAARIIARRHNATGPEANRITLAEARRCLLAVMNAVRIGPRGATTRGEMMDILDGMDALADHHSREAYKAFQSGDRQHGDEQQLGAEWLRDRAHELLGDWFGEPEPLGDADLSEIPNLIPQNAGRAA